MQGERELGISLSNPTEQTINKYNVKKMSPELQVALELLLGPRVSVIASSSLSIIHVLVTI
jgi:hypothetical protein